MNKILATLLALVLLFIAIPAMADNVRTSGLYTYEIKGNGTITITDFNWKENNSDVFIPTMIDGYTVTGIGESAFKVEEALSYSNYSITLPDSIKTIDAFAFWNANIYSINIPNNIQFIGAGAFAGNLSCQFKVTPDHPYYAVIDGALYNKSKKELISYPTRKVRNGYITIPEGILSIGDYAFFKAGENLSFDFPSTLNNIGAHAFEGVSITGGEFPDTVSVIGEYAFANIRWNTKNYKNNKRQLIRLENLQTMGQGAFSNSSCDFCMEISSSSPLKRIESHTFEGSNIDMIYIHSPLEHIGDYAYHSFVGRASAESANITYLGQNVFKSSSMIYFSFDFPPNVDTVPTGFYRVLELPNTVKFIEEDAYGTVSNFKLPSTLERIDSDAFGRGSTFIVESGSYAELWCSENGFGYTIEGQNNLDWLNN